MRYLLIILLALLMTSFSYAKDAETVELTTYYPAPYGDYEELQTDTLTVGLAGSAALDSGVINLRVVDDSLTEPTGTEGSIYYSQSDTELKFHDGSATSPWRSVTGESVMTLLDVDKIANYNPNPLGSKVSKNIGAGFSIDYINRNGIW
jgi:hypothetical protein